MVLGRVEGVEWLGVAVGEGDLMRNRSEWGLRRCVGPAGGFWGLLVAGIVRDGGSLGSGAV